jgi:hypothetical protein
MAVRYGTRLFSDLANAGASAVVNMEYFNNFLIAVDTNGFMWSIDGTGVIRNIWSPAIAAGLTGAPAGWGVTSFVSFAASQGQLTVWNGTDKPLVVSAAIMVTYLQDVATGSNVFVPRCKYGRSHQRFLCAAGDPSAPSTIFIGSADTTGTFFGAPGPNNAVSVDLGSRVPSGDKTIRGLGRYRDKLVITFAEATIIATLGVFDATTGAHLPTFDETIDLIGAVSHRTLQTVVDDILFTDNVGIATLSRTLFNTFLRPERVSALVDPEIQATFNTITQNSVITDKVFSVYNRLEGQYLLFVPHGVPAATEMQCFVYTSIKSQNISHFAEFRGWNWSCACRSSGQRLFFAKGTQIYIYGTLQDPIYGDYVGDQAVFSDGTQFTDGTGFTVVPGELDTGVPITFDWQMPWMDLKSRLNIKSTRFIALDTVGTATFNVDAFVDNLLVDQSDTGEKFLDSTLFTDGFGFVADPVYSPLLSMQMAGGDRLGFGGDGFGNDFGGDRPSRDERLYNWPAKGKIHKLRVWGDAREALRIITITLGYLSGSIRR